MCGIAGIISPFPSFLQPHRLQAMAAALQHRGPDGEGYWTNEEQTVAFAHRRLSILDLSGSAAQPFHYLHYTIVFNGEIYNYIELKQELSQRGYHFTTTTDTEVIPAAYDCWGEDCLQHFDGMFAFLLHDNQQHTLFAARDRFGEKPLYYYPQYADRGRFQQVVFASEIKALFAAGAPRRLNGTMMLNYLALGYVQNPIQKTATFYSDILSLPPGNCLSINPAGGKIKMRKWYKPVFDTISITDNDAIDRFRELLFSSVDRRLRSDVPVGTSLSGGLDSSSILAAIHGQSSKGAQWKNMAFTAGFPNFERDETSQSRAVASAFGIQHYVINPTAGDWLNNWQQLMHQQDEPVQSSSVLVQYLVYKLAKEQGISVLLDGQGADEVLGGYKKHVHWYLQQLLRNDVALFAKEKKSMRQHQFLETWGPKNYIAAYYPNETANRLQKKGVEAGTTNSLSGRGIFDSVPE